MPVGVPFLFLIFIHAFLFHARVFHPVKVFIQVLPAPATLPWNLQHNRDSAAVNLNQDQGRF
jgi:hypothetical protein